MTQNVDDNQRPTEVEDNTQEPGHAIEGNLGDTEPTTPRGDLAGLILDSTAAPALIRVVNTGPAGGYFDPETTAWYDTAIRNPQGIDLDDSISMFKKMYRKTLFEENAARGHCAERYIMIGKALLQTKKRAAHTNVDFKDWADDNLDFMDKGRLVQQTMQLARVKNIDKHTHLGKERLLRVVRAAKDFEGDDPIGAFLQKYGIPSDPMGEQDAKEYLKEVDRACAHNKFCKKLAKAKLPNREVTFELFKSLVDANGKPDDKLIKEVKLAHENNQSVGGYLESLLEGPDKGAYAEAAKSVTKAESSKDGVTALDAKIKWMTDNLTQAKDSIDEQWLADLDMLKANLVALIGLKKAKEQTEAA